MKLWGFQPLAEKPEQVYRPSKPTWGLDLVLGCSLGTETKCSGSATIHEYL